MAHDNERDALKDYLARALDASGEFSTIEPNYRFGNTVEKDANILTNRHVYARKKTPEQGDKTSEYLVLAIADSFPSIGAFNAKMLALKTANIAVLPVFYKGDVFFKWDEAMTLKRDDRKLYTDDDKRRMICTTELERLVATYTGNGKVQGGRVAYWKPSTRELEVVEFTTKVTADYSHIPQYDRPFNQRRDLVKTYVNKVVRAMHAFTMKPVQAHSDVILAAPKSVPMRPNEQLSTQEYAPLLAEINRLDRAGTEEGEERIGIMLNDLKPEALREIADAKGQGFLGLYADYLPTR